MATNNLTGENIVLPIYNQDGTSFNGLVLKKSVYESIVMSLGDKITGDVYYQNNSLVVTMGEYVEYNGVHYVLVNPPVIVREGMISDNGELKGMTKYSFTFYHPMYMLGNFPFCDVAVSSDQQRYLSENKTFAWIGNLVDYVAKINKNLESTEWYCVISDNVQTIDRNKLSEVESFDKNTIAEALKRGYEIWEIPYIISTIASTDPLYAQGKRYLIQYGLPTTEILVENEQHELVPFVFHFGQGVGLKNNSRTPRNNKIVTRIAGYGSEDNIPYGYPQIPYEGGTCQYPLYYGIVGGQRVQLIKHPFTRTHLMPPIYRETVNKKVNPMAVGYDPTIEIKDYYDADNTYENPIKPEEPSYEIHEFEKIKPEFGDNSILGVVPVSNNVVEQKYSTMSSFLTKLRHYMQQTNIDIERHVLNTLYDKVQLHVDDEDGRTDAKQYYFHYKIEVSGDYEKVVYESSNINFEETILLAVTPPAPAWDDEMDDDGNYKQSYFKITIPQLSFDVYASAAVTQEMTVNMRSGACLGCSFPVMVDWDDYKRNFFDEDGNFAPNGAQRDLEKYPNSQSGQIELTLQKETNTFGTLMPNIYQKPAAGDKFVFLGISMPTSYITAAESRLETDMKQYMRDNNVHYFDYPLKFDEKFLVDNIGILNQMQNNVVVRFDYAGEVHALYIKQISVKYENKPLPTYDITLTDDIEIVFNPIGQVTDDVSKLRLALGGGGVGGSVSGDYIRKDIDDTAYGLIRLIKGMQVGERFVTGLLGEGGMFRKESDGTTYLECDKLYVRMRAYFDTVEIRKYIHSGGNRIASLAGIKCSRVEYIDENGNVTNDASDAVKFRCFFRANNDGQEVTNDFVVGDLAFCKETNASEAQGVEQHGYWRAVVGRNAQGVLTSDGEGWIDLSATDCLSGSDIPLAQDDIIQLGNKNDTTRQGAIIEFVGGADAPSYQIYQGINDYSLNGKNYIGLGYSSQNGRAYLNVYGDAYLGDPNESTYIKYNAGTRQLEIKAKISSQSTIDGETIAQFISENTWTEEQIDALITAETDPLVDAIEEIQKQVDGSIETWFYDGVPTLENEPASEWDTTDEKDKHLGDLYYDNLTGYGYRFKYDELNHQYSWIRITDVDVVKALADAAKAQDTADHKRRVFVVQPTPPYDAGDLWVNATYPVGNTETNAVQSKYYNDVLRCNTSKAEGTTFAIADWGLASKYTDDKALNDFKANQYVQQLTNGTISTNIQSAQNAADAAQQAADDAQADADAAATAAANAQTSATNANNRLDGWADDGKISPTEKTSLKLEWENVKKEYAQICNDADEYDVEKTAFTSAYTSANAAFQKYTAATPENITIGSDYANIAAYYAARQTILDAITDAAKKVATDAQAAAQAAEAHAATLDYVKTALKQDTVIEGGLVLSTLIALRDGSNHIWSGISGTYQSAETGTGYKGHGIAAWYGGAMVDKEVTTTATDYAKSLFRFDGSGYVAGGNLSWDKSGNVTIQGHSINATTLKVGGSAVATQAELDSYLPLSAGSNKKLTDTLYSQSILPKTDNTYNLGGTSNYWKYLYVKRIYLSADVYLEYDSTNTAVKLNGSFYATGGITALGAGSGGSGGGVDMNTVWTALGNATNEQINATHLSTALSAYNPTSNFKTINGNSIIGTGNIVIQSSGGTVTAVKVGSTTYNPTDGVVSLPAYPTSVTSANRSQYLETWNADQTVSYGNNYKLLAYFDTSSRVHLKCDNYQIYVDKADLAVNANSANLALNLYKGRNDSISTPSVYMGYGAGIMSESGSMGGDWGLRVVSIPWGNNTGGFPTAFFITKGRIKVNQASSDDAWGSWNTIAYTNDNVESATNATYANYLKCYYSDAFNTGNRIYAKWTNNRYELVEESENYTVYVAKSGSAESATKLANARTIWGQSFDGTGNVSGAISGATTISASSNVSIGGTLSVTGATTLSSTFGVTGNTTLSGTLSVSKATTLSSTLGVSGLLTASGGITIPSGKTLTIGDAVLSWDSTNQGIKITKGLYSETFISALGSGGSGGSGVDMNTVWTALGNATNEQINASHLSTALNPYATQTWVTQQIAASATGGTVTAVKVGTTTYNPSSGVVSLPAYPTSVASATRSQYLETWNSSQTSSCGDNYKMIAYFDSQSVIHFKCNNYKFQVDYANALDVHDWAKASSKPTYTFSEITSKPYDMLTVSSSFSSEGTWYRIAETTGSGSVGMLGCFGNFSICDMSTWNPSSVYLVATVEIGSVDLIQVGGIGYNNGQSITKARICYVTTWNSSLKAYLEVYSSNGGQRNVKIDYQGTGWTLLTPTTVSETPTDGRTSYAIDLHKRGIVAESFYGTFKGNVDTATTLQTARTLWGQSFDGSANVSGDMTGVGRISASGTISSSGGSLTTDRFLTIYAWPNYGTGSANIWYSNSDSAPQTLYIQGATTIYLTGSLYNVWHSGNDGSGSGLDADLLDGQHGSYYGKAADITTLQGYFTNGVANNATNSYKSKYLETFTGSAASATYGDNYKFYVYWETGSIARLAIQGGFAIRTHQADKLVTARTIWGQNFDGSANVSGAITGATTISASSNVSVGGTLGVTGATTLSSTLGVTGATTLSSTLGVSGATTMSGKLTMSKSNIELVNTSSNDGICVELKGVSEDFGLAVGSGDTNRGIIDFKRSGWMIYFDASNTYCEYGNFICSGGVTALSDARHKRIVSNTDITIEQIARMRSVKFLWNDGRNDDAIHVGSIAQDWQSILPEVVIRKDDKDGTLSLNYGVAALVSVITTARKVVDHERRIKELEKENERLRFEVEQLKIA